MVLTNPVLPGGVLQLARPEKAPLTGKTVPHAALARLPALRQEARQDIGLLQFLARAPQACLILLTAGASLLIWTRLTVGLAPLEREFAWVSAVLIGIAAMTGLHIRSYAWGAAQMPLHQAANTQRWLLFYTGMAWGAGAFLVMPSLPALAIGFAIIPSLGLSLLLGDQKGATAFTAPVILATASEACLAAWPSWVAATILGAGLAIFCLPMVQREISGRRDLLSASKAL
jgi:hypothetical protein